MSSLKQWIISATGDEIALLAKEAGTSKAYLHQIATGHRRASACSAGIIVDAANKVRAGNPRLPLLRRGDLCEACSACPHFQSSII